MIRGDQSYVAKVNEEVSKLKEQAAEARAKFNQKVNQDQMDQVAQRVNEYAQALAFVN